MGKTSIEWTDASWNPVVGCTEVSPGCANCYAARLAATRLKHVAEYVDLAEIKNGTPRWKGEVGFCPDRLEEPLHWRKPRRIFVCDMGDLFHESVKDAWLKEIFEVMLRAEQHTFQILTKRAARMHAWIDTYSAPFAFPRKNIWLGVSVENQHFADERISALLSTPAAVRFISAEPLLGSVDLHSIPDGSTGYYDLAYPGGSGRFDHQGSRISDARLDWVICGGESGPGARPMHPDWARSLRDQCQAAGVPFFFKQWGEFVPCDQVTTEELIGNGRKQFVKTCGNFCCREHRHIEHGELMTVHAGKKAAGRLLDGREWNDFPSR